MIAQGNMFEPMLAACPSFIPTWAEFCTDWDESSEKPLYIALGDLSRHLVSQFRLSETSEFPAVFQVVERWHLEGDAFVREAATIGLLESLQNNASHAELDPDVFLRWLLPESRTWWDKLNRFWDGDFRALNAD